MLDFTGFMYCTLVMYVRMSMNGNNCKRVSNVIYSVKFKR